MTGLAYNLLLLIAFPVACLYFLWRVVVSKKSNESWRENLGRLPNYANRPADRKLIWLHAVSVGEVVASLPLQEEIRRRLPDAVILVTTITQTGNAMAKKAAKCADSVSYFPVDYPVIVKRALNRVKPDVIVLMEAEIWPNFLAAAAGRGIPVILVNGHVSDRNMRRSKYWRWLISWSVAKISRFCMQTQTDAERITALGANRELVSVCGNMKFDQEGGKLGDDAIRALRADLGLPDGVPALVAGSTNPGEEEPVLSAFRQLRHHFGELRLIVAPRQIERAEEIKAMAESYGFSCGRRSERQGLVEHDVLVLDTFGELASVYAVGEVAFVGGTLIKKGGHSIIQPMLQGKPILFGPHTFKTRDVAEIAKSAGIGFEVQDSRQLAEVARTLLEDPARRAAIESACEQVIRANQGASIRCAQAIMELLGIPTEARGGQ